MSLVFSPLYWIYHDCWDWTETVAGNPKPTVTTYHHAGHIHLFMPDYSPLKQGTQQAYTGTQSYRFRLKDVWGPNSENPNQTHSYRLVGKPRWYFRIREYWRRAYIQPWDIEDYTRKYPNHPERIGIRYDASMPEHTLGPFREGRGLYFFNPDVNRTLPVEYWLDESKRHREHYLPWDETQGGQDWWFAADTMRWQRRGRGMYWGGDNARYSGNTYIGYFKKGDIVAYGYRRGADALPDDIAMESVENTRYYRNTFRPGSRDTNGAYWPNPTPGGDFKTLSRDYLRYMDFRGSGSRYVDAYEQYIENNALQDTEETFRAYVAARATEFHENCFRQVENLVTFQVTIDHNTLEYEYLTYDEYCGIWERLSEKEEANLFGSYPRKRDDAPPLDDPPYDENFRDREGNPVNPYELYKTQYAYRDVYTIPRGKTASGDSTAADADTHPRAVSYSDEDGARRHYRDDLYLSPVIEYQTVWQLGDGEGGAERLPESASREAGIDVMTDQTENWGEGFEVEVQIPFRKNGKIQSPFSDDNKKVYPVGTYMHDVVRDADKVHYAVKRFGTPITDEQLAEFMRNAKADSMLPGMTNVKKYAQRDYYAFMKTSPDFPAQRDWFNANYADRPITLVKEEGRFDEDGNWIEVNTNDRPDPDTQVSIDEETGRTTMAPKAATFTNPGYPKDGTWVEQCLGGEVIPSVELVFEDALGHRWTEWVTELNATSGVEFVGTGE